jgi:hypothetical protein
MKSSLPLIADRHVTQHSSSENGLRPAVRSEVLRIRRSSRFASVRRNSASRKAVALSVADARTTLPPEREIAALGLPLPPHSHHGVNAACGRQVGSLLAPAPEMF